MTKLHVLFALVALLVSSCADGSKSRDLFFESSRPANEIAAEHPETLPPAKAGFDAPATMSMLNDGLQFPRWFCPTSVVTRAQTASFIARAMYGPGMEMSTAGAEFSDIPSTNTHAGAVQQIFEDGISDGCNPGAFCPGHGVSRGQMATFVMRAAHGRDFQPPAAQGAFIDVVPQHPHAAAIEQLVRDGASNLECGEAQFCPDAPLTREAMASFLVHVVHPDGDLGYVQTGTFADIAASNPHAKAVEVIARAGVTYGCDAPSVSYRIDGHPLSDLQREWLLYFAGSATPRLARAYNSLDRAREVSALAIWWSLRRDVFGKFDDPFRHSTCATEAGLKHLGLDDTCVGDWQVGLVATEISRAQPEEVRNAVQALYPGRNEDQLALDLVDFGRALSTTSDAGEYPYGLEDEVLADPLLLRSWLARDPAIGAWATADDIERECIVGDHHDCFSTMTEASRRYAGSKQIALQTQAELVRMLTDLRPR